jgi:hypothetical protein
VLKVPKIVACRYFLEQHSHGAAALRSLVLEESLATSQKVKTVFAVIEFFEPIRGKRRDRVLVVRGILLAPIKQRKQETKNRHAVHGVAGGDLANPACLSQRLNNAHAIAMPTFPQNGNPRFFEQVIVHGLLLALGRGGWQAHRAPGDPTVRWVATKG